MPAVDSKALTAGKVGLVGLTGNTGASWISNDAPSDGNTYGRVPGGWVPVIPLSGGTLTSGIRWNDVVAASGTDCSKHITITTSTYGINVTGNTLNYYGNYGVQAYCSGQTNVAIMIGYNGSTYRQIAFSNQSNPFIRWNSSTGDLDIQMMPPGGQIKYVSGRFDFYGLNYGTYCVGELWVTDVGKKPYLNTYVNGNNWRWDGTWMLTRVDNSVEYPVAVACDERMKQDIAPSEFDALAAIRKVRLFQFRWQDHHQIPGWVKRNPDAPIIPIGFIAQRLYEDFPHAVKTGGTFVGAKLLWTPERLTLLATLCRAVQQLDERVQALAQHRG